MKKLFSILSAAVIVLSVAAVMAFAVGDGKPAETLTVTVKLIRQMPCLL